jgi:hypothetical protein
VLLVGSPGSGKTTFALQFPKPYIFDADNNLAGPRRWMTENKKPEFLYDIGNVKPDGTPVGPFARYTNMTQCLNEAAKSDEIDTLIVDSLTAVQEYVKDDIFRQRVEGQTRGRTKVMITEQNKDIGQLTEPEWGIYARYFTTLITTLRTFPKLVVFTAHSESRRKGENGPWEDTIAIQGASRYKFSAQFSDCIELVSITEGFGDSIKVKRTFRHLPASEIDQRGLKSSFSLPPVFEDPNLLLDQLK